MVKKKLSKSEYKYRYKYIYENHLNKYMQQKLNMLVATDPKIRNYKNLYQAYRKGDYLLMLCVTSNMMDTSINEVVKSFNQLNNIIVDVNKLDEIAEAFCKCTRSQQKAVT